LFGAAAKLTRSNWWRRAGTAAVAAWIAAASAPGLAGIHVSAARIWPGPEYTRLTIESTTPLSYSVFTIENPSRLVMDLDGVDPGPAFESLPSKLSPDDPYVGAIRVGRFRPGMMRLVLDLKQPVNPQVFALKPVGDYGHRLVLDIYPTVPFDPIVALLQRKGGAAGGQPSAPPSPPPTAAPQKGAPASPARPAPEVMRLVTVAVDAGHGGEDPGAKGRRGTYEKFVTLSIARKIKALIDEVPGMRCVLIRDGDYFVPLAKRVERARKVQADLFVSIHADAYIKPHARGSSVFALSESGATSAAANWLAKHENEADLIGGVNIDVEDMTLKQVLIDLSQTATINDSLKLARAVLDEIGDVNTLHRASVEQAGFAVLKAPDIPSILVETAFLTNPDEELRLRDEKYQDQMAAAIFSGIKRYFARNPPLARSRLAQN